MSQNPEVTDDIQQPVTVLVIDNHGLSRAGVCSELVKYPQQVQIVGGAVTAEEAAAAVTKIRPQVALLDVHLPGGHGSGGAEVAAAPGNEATRFLALSVSDAAEGVVTIIRAGARGYITKTISTPDLVDSIIRVTEGDVAFSPRLVGFVLDAFGVAHSEIVEIDNGLDSLTSHEFEVTRLIARGYAYKEIALKLYISVRTVESHVSAVLRKLQLSNRYKLPRWTAEHRIN